MEHILEKLVSDFESGKMNRRQLIQSLALAATAATATATAPAADNNTVLKAVDINHISYQVADYAKTRDFYSDLFGMAVAEEDTKRKQCRLIFGDSIIVARTGPSNAPTPRIDHISLTIANWDKDKTVQQRVLAELKRRDLEIRTDPTGYDIKDLDGFQVQIGGHKQ